MEAVCDGRLPLCCWRMHIHEPDGDGVSVFFTQTLLKEFSKYNKGLPATAKTCIGQDMPCVFSLEAWICWEP